MELRTFDLATPTVSLNKGAKPQVAALMDRGVHLRADETREF